MQGFFGAPAQAEEEKGSFNHRRISLREWTRRPSFVSEDTPAQVVTNGAAEAPVTSALAPQPPAPAKEKEPPRDPQASYAPTATMDEACFSRAGRLSGDLDESFDRHKPSPRGVMRYARRAGPPLLRALTFLLLYYAAVAATFMNLEDWSLLDSVYFATVLMSTVGCTRTPMIARASPLPTQTPWRG